MIRLVLLRFLESYFRHRWLYLFPVGLLLAVGIVSLVIAEPQYIAGGVLRVKNESFLASLTSVRNDNLGWWVTPAEATVAEMVDLLQTDAFMRAVISETKLEGNMSYGPTAVSDTIDEARQAIWTQTLGDYQITVHAAHYDPEVAYQLVVATVDNFIQWKINADLTDSEAAQTFFNSVLHDYEGQLEMARADLRAYLLAHPEPVRGERPELEQMEIDRLESEMKLAGTRYANALQKDEDARLASAQAESDARQSYILIDAPRMPTEPEFSLKDTAVQLVIFTTAGIILSGIGVAGSALLDRSLRFPLDVRLTTGLPVLTVVPDATPRRRFWASLLPGRRRRETAVSPLPALAQPSLHVHSGDNGRFATLSSTIDVDETAVTQDSTVDAEEPVVA